MLNLHVVMFSWAGRSTSIMDFRQKLFQYRSYTPIPFLVAMVFLAHSTFVSLVAGLLFAIIGESLRLWGVSFAGGETRTRGPVGGSKLVTQGPFAYVRNPLYLGNMLIYFGIGIMANVPILALASLIYFFVQYTLIVSLEEESLLKLFGTHYTDYVQAVPRFIPSFSRYKDNNTVKFECSWKKGITSEKRSLQAICLASLLLIFLWYLRS